MKRVLLASIVSLGAVSLAHAQTIFFYAPVNYAAPTTGSVSTTTTIVQTPGAKVTKICNTTATGGGNIWLNPNGGTAVSQKGDEAAAGGGCVIYGSQVLNSNGNIITGVSDSGTATYTVTLGN